MQEAADAAVRLGEREHRPLGIEVVHRHREAALRLRAPPRGRHRLELGVERLVNGVGLDDAEAVARLRQP